MYVGRVRRCESPRVSIISFVLAVGYPKAWAKVAEKSLKGESVESLESKTPEGITLKPLYCAADVKRCEAVADAERDAPGLFPYHR